MNSLNYADKKNLEKLLKMEQGHVLDFTNAGFKSFFNDFKIDIYSEQYESKGTGKANRLRVFLAQEDDDIRASVIAELIKLSPSKNDSLKAECTAITSKLNPVRLNKNTSVSQPRNNNNIQLFISHHHDDREELSSLKKQLQAYDINAFLAHEDIEIGQHDLQSIQENLQNCDIFLLIGNEKSMNSKFVNQEIGYALGQKK